MKLINKKVMIIFLRVKKKILIMEGFYKSKYFKTKYKDGFIIRKKLRNFIGDLFVFLF